MKYISSHIINIITCLLITSLIALIIIFQVKQDKLSRPFTTRVSAETRSLLPADILPYITFGFTNIITDSYWIRAVQDFTVWDKHDPYYLNYFKNISALDSTFEYPYLFSILIVPQKKDIFTLDRVAVIAERGIDTIPTSWKIPFYLGTQYYLFTKNYEPTLHYLEVAGKRTGAPDGVYLTYSSLIAKQAGKGIKGDDTTSQDLIKVIYNNTDNETIKKMAGKGLEEGFINQMLEKGIFAYKAKYKKYPKSVDEMMALNLISLPQEMLDGFIVVINQRDGSFKVEER